MKSIKREGSGSAGLGYICDKRLARKRVARILNDSHAMMLMLIIISLVPLALYFPATAIKVIFKDTKGGYERALERSEELSRICSHLCCWMSCLYCPLRHPPMRTRRP